MNNRGAVKCQSLRLNKNYLDTHLPNWRKIANTLANDSLKENLKNCTTNKSDIDLTLLHRLLDTSSSIDSYKLREYNIENYIDILGKDDSLKFKKFTQNYYETITKKFVLVFGKRLIIFLNFVITIHPIKTIKFIL